MRSCGYIHDICNHGRKLPGDQYSVTAEHSFKNPSFHNVYDVFFIDRLVIYLRGFYKCNRDCTCANTSGAVKTMNSPSYHRFSLPVFCLHLRGLIPFSQL